MDLPHVTFSDQALAPRPPPSPPHQQPISTQPKKLRRISRACGFCHKRSIRCSPSHEDPRCKNCVDFAVACTYNRPNKKRGIKYGSTKSPGRHGGSPGRSQNGETGGRILSEMTNDYIIGASSTGAQSRVPGHWKTMVLDNEEKIHSLVEIYFEVVYPIFPLFHQPSMIRRIADRDYITDVSFFANTMAICALASARARDGALFPGRFDSESFQMPSSETFFAAVKEVLPQELSGMRGLGWMCTCALLALYGIQVGKIDIMHQYLGTYHNLVSMDSLHDENNWPKDMEFVETEMRRRLFWSMYTFEVYSSIVWGGVIRCRESQSSVAFPSEVDDDLFSDSDFQKNNTLYIPFSPQSRHNNPMCWLHGWNFTTHLYRMLEHAIDDYRRGRPTNSTPCSLSRLFHRNTAHRADVLEQIVINYDELPLRFKEPALVSIEDQGSQEYKFALQAANLTATLQLARLILVTCEDTSVEQRCAVARDLLESFERVPVHFLRAISCPLLHHVAAIGNVLTTVIEGPISEPSYEQVRTVLSAMVKLLSSLEGGITRKIGVAARLSKQILQMDMFMASRPQIGPVTNGATYPPSIVLPTDVKQEINPNIDPELQDLMAPFTSGMQSSSLITPTNPFGNSHAANGFRNEHINEQIQLSQELVENLPYPGFFGSGVGGGFGMF
ncbi:hypothetical protein BKA65DRAFT_483766 [Rhexocercosporidium sp. MPI-PUGE-AT-0058]|nr:hypothetical protein BKA65DRAFT_483766 [Rhexocercosporidium sp. MPI-PUGE-AT-0058]